MAFLKQVGGVINMKHFPMHQPKRQDAEQQQEFITLLFGSIILLKVMETHHPTPSVYIYPVGTRNLRSMIFIQKMQKIMRMEQFKR